MSDTAHAGESKELHMRGSFDSFARELTQDDNRQMLP